MKSLRGNWVGGEPKSPSVEKRIYGFNQGLEDWRGSLLAGIKGSYTRRNDSAGRKAATRKGARGSQTVF